MLSDTQLALASLEISLLKLAKEETKKENTILCLSRKTLVGIQWQMQGHSLDVNYPFTLANSRRSTEEATI